MTKNLQTASKFLSLILRHQPDVIGIELDDEGWADIGQLVALSAAKGKGLSRELILEVVATSDKQRFAIDASGTRIRANQGHSIEVDLKLAPQTPPPMLFHGTATRFADAIRAEGLRPGSRQHVHLSADAATATIVGARHGKPLILQVRAGEMQRDGMVFYMSANGVWLTDGVPAAYLDFPG